MNKKVRDYLIELAKNKKAASYSQLVYDCQLGLDLENPSDRNILADILGDISIYEHQQDRPLLSALVLYKDRNDHGIGFYTICEQLNIGKGRVLQKAFYAFEEMNKCYTFWKNNSPAIEVIVPSFFSKSELLHFQALIQEKYQSESEESKEQAQSMLPVYKKTNYWAEHVRPKGFVVEFDNRWQISGNYKKYTWCKIYRKGDKDKLIFFTVGTSGDTEELVYKLDCKWSSKIASNQLSEDQIESFYRFIKDTGAQWRSVSFNRLSQYTWEKLITETRAFIETYSELYDDVIDYVWGRNETPLAPKPGLTLKQKPKGKHKEYPSPNYIHQGVEKDFVGQNQYQHQIGKQGEEMVIAYEKKQLKDAGRKDLAENVRKVLDGEGFDILSFDADGTEKFIEVKTTKGDEDSPFFLSDAELAFLKANRGKYVIYRIFNFKPLHGSGDFYILDGDIENGILLYPKTYSVLLKGSAL